MTEPALEFPGPLPRGINRPFEKHKPQDVPFGERPMVELFGQTLWQVLHQELRLKRGKQPVFKEKSIWDSKEKDVLKRRPIGAYVKAEWDPEIPYVNGDDDDQEIGKLSKGRAVKLHIAEGRIVDVQYSLPQGDSKIGNWGSLLHDPEWKDYARFFERTGKAVPTTAKISFAISKAKRR